MLLYSAIIFLAAGFLVMHTTGQNTRAQAVYPWQVVPRTRDPGDMKGQSFVRLVYDPQMKGTGVTEEYTLKRHCKCMDTLEDKEVSQDQKDMPAPPSMPKAPPRMPKAPPAPTPPRDVKPSKQVENEDKESNSPDGKGCIVEKHVSSFEKDNGEPEKYASSYEKRTVPC